MSQVPMIDLTPYRCGGDREKASVAQAVDKACREIGFLVVAGHGVASALIADTERVSHAFFDLPLEEKMKVARPAPDVLRGYVPVSAESLSRSMGIKAAGDLNELLMIGEPNVPDEPYYRGKAAGHHFRPQSVAGTSGRVAHGFDGVFPGDGTACDQNPAGLCARPRCP